MLVKGGTDKKVGKYSVLALVNLKDRTPAKTEPTSFYDEVDGKKIIIDYAGGVKNDEINCAIKNDMQKQYAQKETLKEETPVKVKSTKEKKSGKTLWSLTAGAEGNTNLDNFGGNIGFRCYPNGGKLGFGLAAEGSIGLDKIIKSYRDLLIDNLSTVGNARRTNDFSLGLSGELQLGPFLIGAGAKYNSSITEKTVELFEGNDVIKSNSDSDLKKEIFGKVYAGIEVPLSSSFGLDALGGYDGKDGIFFGLKSNIKLK
jgi:hypothetical protein